MSFQDLVGWLEIANLPDYSPEQIANALLSGLEDADSHGPALVAELTDLYHTCQAGTVPAARILGLVHFGGAAVEEEPEGVRLERELRELAKTLPESRWRTANYNRVERGLQAAEQGNTESLEEAIDEMRTVLVDAWAPYLEMPLSRSEIVAESVVGHRLLVEGFRGWAAALDLLDAALDGEVAYSVGRAKLEEANRMLVAVQFLAKRSAA